MSHDSPHKASSFHNVLDTIRDSYVQVESKCLKNCGENCFSKLIVIVAASLIGGILPDLNLKKNTGTTKSRVVVQSCEMTNNK